MAPRKFRVRDKVEKRWVGDVLLRGDGTIWVRSADGSNLLDLDPERYEVQFSTGLVCDDQEIFDGDRVAMVDGYFTVEWNDDTCAWQFSDGSPINDGDRYGSSKNVIGNINESPERLAR